MASAAGKKESVSLSQHMEVNNLEIEDDLTTMATLFWADGVWMGKWKQEQPKARRKQILQAQTWRQVRETTGAVKSETRDLGIKWPQWHTLMFEEQVAVDMRVVFPQDVKKMLLRWASVFC